MRRVRNKVGPCHALSACQDTDGGGERMRTHIEIRNMWIHRGYGAENT